MLFEPEETRKYYIYAHSKPNGEVFYVGKGCGPRMHKTSNRSAYWKRIAKKYGFVPHLLYVGLNELQSYEKEIQTIAFYKQKQFCESNMTVGGDGIIVEKRWWGEAISKGLKSSLKFHLAHSKGITNPSYVQLSKETICKLYVEDGLSTPEICKKLGVSYPTIISRLRDYGISVRTPGRTKIKIKCIDDGKEFSSISEAAGFYGVHTENIRKVLKGIYKHTGKRRFVCHE